MPQRKKKSLKSGTGDVVYQLKVKLAESQPPIWRRLLVPGNITLGELHAILQAVMGWDNSHLHQFNMKEVFYSDPRFGLEDAEDEDAVTLSELVPRDQPSFQYLYDFGDGWEHEVKIEKIFFPQPGQSYPCCVAGERACPPEDCGGIWGYENLLEAISDPKHEEHEEMLEWIGGSFDAEAFDVAKVNDILARISEMREC